MKMNSIISYNTKIELAIARLKVATLYGDDMLTSKDLVIEDVLNILAEYFILRNTSNEE